MDDAKKFVADRIAEGVKQFDEFPCQPYPAAFGSPELGSITASGITYEGANHFDITMRRIHQAVMAERERCAKIAEGMWGSASDSNGVEYILRHQIAAEIRKS
jgi:hypothetical protein